jgi:hypothetical protein
MDSNSSSRYCMEKKGSHRNVGLIECSPTCKEHLSSGKNRQHQNACVLVFDTVFPFSLLPLFLTSVNFMVSSPCHSMAWIILIYSGKIPLLFLDVGLGQPHDTSWFLALKYTSVSWFLICCSHRIVQMFA